MKTTLTTASILSTIILSATNIYYVLSWVPPDGRWKVQVPVTSFLVLVYLALSFFVTKRLLKNTKKYYLMFLFNIVLSVVFLIFAKKIEVSLQYVDLMYIFQYISIAPYILIFGLGFVLYLFAVMFLDKKRE
jgi:hypothetical protein